MIYCIFEIPRIRAPNDSDDEAFCVIIWMTIVDESVGVVVTTTWPFVVPAKIVY